MEPGAIRGRPSRRGRRGSAVPTQRQTTFSVLERMGHHAWMAMQADAEWSCHGGKDADEYADEGHELPLRKGTSWH